MLSILASNTLVPLDVRISTSFLLPNTGFKPLNASLAISSKSVER